MTKECKNCKIVKDTEDFYRMNKRPGIYQSYCKECHREINSKNRHINKQNGPTIHKDSKVCAKCNTKKPRSQFGVRRDKSDGLMSYCKPCWSFIVKVNKNKKKMV
jgi:hypothetical protein